MITIGEIELDNSSYRASRRGQQLDLTRKEFELLKTLMQQPGRVVARNDIIDRVWQTDWVGDTCTLDVHIRWLREKTEEDPGRPKYIQTVHGAGHRFATAEDIK